MLTDTVSDEGLEATEGADSVCCTLTSYYRYSGHLRQSGVGQSPRLEENLTYDVSDEALEATAGTQRGGVSVFLTFQWHRCC
jgi:hypothetical protein